MNKPETIAAQVQRGWPALIVAVQRGNSEAVKLLLNNCTDINAKWRQGGATALKLAKAKGYKEITEFLKARGAME